MRRLNFLVSGENPLVLDASAVINLCASKASAEILRALRRPLTVVHQAANELTCDRRTGRNDGHILTTLVAEGLVEIATLGEQEGDIFAELTIGPATETLDDGEAATIAHAVARRSIAIVDERKALQICGRRYPTMLTGSTVDIFAHNAVLDALGIDGLRDAVVNALVFARMRVPLNHVDWVFELIGEERALECPSLPRGTRMRTTARNELAGTRRGVGQDTKL